MRNRIKGYSRARKGEDATRSSEVINYIIYRVKNNRNNLTSKCINKLWSNVLRLPNIPKKLEKDKFNKIVLDLIAMRFGILVEKIIEGGEFYDNYDWGVMDKPEHGIIYGNGIYGDGRLVGYNFSYDVALGGKSYGRFVREKGGKVKFYYPYKIKD